MLLLLGIFLGALPVLAWHASERQLRGRKPPEEPAADVVPPGVATVLNVLRSSALVVDAEDRVVQASAPAYSLGLVRDGELRNDELAALVAKVRRDGEIRQVDLDIHRTGQQPVHVNARVAALSSRLVLVLTEDRTRERRVDAIRRDFVANVSHELKTPVGALTLLAEAVREAADDPEAVQRFAARMQTEAVRLNRLVQQIIELSRLQGDEALERPAMVPVDRVVERSIDFNEIEATAKGIEVVYDGRRGLSALGNPDQVSLAVSNLVANAIAYSPEGSRVVVSALQQELMVDITVTDEGIGIPRAELDRIFERFYRVDPARHRSTGGTGLGLSIVKHVAATHGGEVKVWSEPGKGSSFTLRLPRHTATPAPAPGPAPDRASAVPTPVPSVKESS
ncbi:two-component sensor histidine kinase [Nocardioides sp. HDW12B]|nr:two-component sensor histidine kinase [Nocardioides sp. HDW12B]